MWLTEKSNLLLTYVKKCSLHPKKDHAAFSPPFLCLLFHNNCRGVISFILFFFALLLFLLLKLVFVPPSCGVQKSVEVGGVNTGEYTESLFWK